MGGWGGGGLGPKGWGGVWYSGTDGVVWCVGVLRCGVLRWQLYGCGVFVVVWCGVWHGLAWCGVAWVVCVCDIV